MKPAASPKPVLLVALGGNALIRKGQTGTANQQLENLKIPARQIARLASDYRIIITHGNGPQVGNLMLQQECCDTVERMPLEILVAQTQGQIGYMIESTLDEAFMERGINTQPLVSLISYVVIDEQDPSFHTPSKPIGPAFDREKALSLPYPVVETPKGFRRVVVSPKPVTIVEKREIKTLIDKDFIVICCGGGGIPVVRKGRTFDGVDAVIDKDLASARLAEEVGVDLFVIATDVQGVALDFGKPTERFLDTISLDEISRYMLKDQFSAGAMLPKVEAAMQFVASGGGEAVITHIESLEAAVRGEAGTRFVP
jgi:carbamate kinase